MNKFGIGQPVLRDEDIRFISGKGLYTGDISLTNQTYMYVLRSNVSNGIIKSIDIDDALKSSGVINIFLGKDLREAGIKDMPTNFIAKNKDDSDMYTPERPAIAIDKVRHVGDPIAIIIAESIEQAKNASELIFADIEEIASVTSCKEAIKDDSPQVWENTKNNLCFDWEMGEQDKVKDAFKKADSIVEIELINNRIVPNSMETRGAVANYNKEDGRYELSCSSQGVHSLRDRISNVLNIEPSEIRVITTDVGGGFGMKIFNYPEYICSLFASKIIGRPVKWVSDRSEAFLSDTHGRDHVTKAKLALDKEGIFLGIKIDTVANMGAYLSNFAIFIPTLAGTAMLAGCYKTPAIYVNVKGVFTNTPAIDAYRGAGRPEASFVIERLVDVAGIKSGLGPIEIRRRNLIPSSEMPYKTALNHTYDTGDFIGNMELAVKDSDWQGFKDRAKISKENNKIRGIGLSTYIEACSGGGPEEATIILEKNGSITLHIGTQSNGQGHETAYKQILCEYLGIGPEKMTVVQGDTDVIAFGAGTGGSRSVPVGGAAIKVASENIINKTKSLAAQKLNIDESTLEYKEGIFLAEGTNLTISLEDLAKDSNEPIKISSQWTPPNYTFPNGCHICELEVDKDTGHIEIKKYTVVDDFGLVINPNMLAGQVHGGIAQGIGQAIYENTVYDSENGQLLSGSFMDYALPRAEDLINVDIRWNMVPCETNLLQIKGAGEAGAIGAPPAVINALVNALNIEHIDMPATPNKVWSKLHSN
ncbi:MAG: xanthine dehydrogenase family protein molybdopterin-binding subunit [Alphaproteobacteria bacterium]|nr:xanthine dehydrogenase family protein molybdopterin-binding subunit [Alphaproteobacteria bacterium]